MKHLYKRFFPTVFATALVISSIPVYPLAAQADTSSDNLKILTRVYDTTNDSLLHYHYEDTNGNVVSLNDNTATTSSSKKKAAALPSSYDLRTQNAVTSIKDQGVTGSCWTFGAIKALESNLIMQGLGSADQTDLSESHLAWYTYHTSSIANDLLAGEGCLVSHYHSSPSVSQKAAAYMLGGNALSAAFTLARGSGAVNESTAPFSADTINRLNSMASSMNAAGDSLFYQKDYILTDASCYDNSSHNTIKNVLMENGALDVAFYYSKNYDHTTSAGTAYYQEKYTDDTVMDPDLTAASYANHCVTIVGWDDNYSKENFGTYQPSSDGAWLIANNYGSDYGDDGYFWISYEEPTLTEFYSFKAASASTYDNAYQYDGFGWGNAISSGNTSTLAANIFTANTDYNQNLDSVGIYTIEDNQPYTISIYKNISGNVPTNGTLVETISGTQAYNGYHVITLDQSVSLNAGETFSVVISYDKTSNVSGYIPIEGGSYDDGSTKVTYTSQSNQSFLYLDNQWSDLSDYDSRNDLENNVCLKAFTTNTSKADNTTNSNNSSNNNSAGSSQNTTTGNSSNITQSSSNGINTKSSTTNNTTAHTNNSQTTQKIAFSSSKLTLGAKESYSLSSLLKTNTTGSVSYQSSKSSVAAVSRSGKITTKKRGSATITASLPNGAKASIKITVKKAPSKVMLSPSGSKKIKKGKKLSLKVKLSKGSASRTMRYTSSKPSVASVSSNGKITAKKKGTAIITAKTYNNKKAKLKIIVK